MNEDETKNTFVINLFGLLVASMMFLGLTLSLIGVMLSNQKIGVIGLILLISPAIPILFIGTIYLFQTCRDISRFMWGKKPRVLSALEVKVIEPQAGLVQVVNTGKICKIYVEEKKSREKEDSREKVPGFVRDGWVGDLIDLLVVKDFPKRKESIVWAAKRGYSPIFRRYPIGELSIAIMLTTFLTGILITGTCIYLYKLPIICEIGNYLYQLKISANINLLYIIIVAIILIHIPALAYEKSNKKFGGDVYIKETPNQTNLNTFSY